MDRIAYLEGRLGKPVVSSNQASLWAVLRAINVDTTSISAGSLFSRPAAVKIVK
jgi:maleate cis-trans isomerase